MLFFFKIHQLLMSNDCVTYERPGVWSALRSVLGHESVDPSHQRRRVSGFRPWEKLAPPTALIAAPQTRKCKRRLFRRFSDYTKKRGKIKFKHNLLRLLKHLPHINKNLYMVWHCVESLLLSTKVGEPRDTSKMRFLFGRVRGSGMGGQGRGWKDL
jgi:hypothetical protein